MAQRRLSLCLGASKVENQIWAIPPDRRMLDRTWHQPPRRGILGSTVLVRPTLLRSKLWNSIHHVLAPRLIRFLKPAAPAL
jgi:hypothetical protein